MPVNIDNSADLKRKLDMLIRVGIIWSIKWLETVRFQNWVKGVRRGVALPATPFMLSSKGLLVPLLTTLLLSPVEWIFAASWKTTIETHKNAWVHTNKTLRKNFSQDMPMLSKIENKKNRNASLHYNGILQYCDTFYLQGARIATKFEN